MGLGKRPRTRITPPCMPGRFCDRLERLRFKKAGQFYISNGSPSIREKGNPAAIRVPFELGRGPEGGIESLEAFGELVEGSAPTHLAVAHCIRRNPVMMQGHHRLAAVLLERHGHQ